MKFLASIALVLAFLGACASGPDNVAADAPQQQCTRVYHVGSNVPTRECTTPVSEEERQRMLDEWRKAVRPQPARTNPSGGG